MKIKLEAVLDAIEMADDAFTYFYDMKEETTVCLSDPFIVGETDSELAELIDNSTGRFFRLPTKFDIHEHNIMERFVDSLPAGAIQNQLGNAIRGKGAFRRFKDAINRLGITQQWYDYQTATYRKIAVQWCNDNGFEYD